MQVCKPSHYTLVEAVEPFKLPPMSMAYPFNLFKHLLRLWMGIWLHTHPVTTTNTSPDLGMFAEILPDASVQTMPLHFDWVCRTFQTAFHVHVIHIWDVWVPYQVVDGHMDSHSHHYHHRCFSRSMIVGWKPTQTLPLIWESWLKSFLLQVFKPCHYSLVETVEPFKLHHMYMSYQYEDLSTFSGCGWAYGFTFTSLPPQTLPRICENWLKSYLMQVCKPCHYTLVEAVELFKLHSMSMAYPFEMFKHLLRLWMGIWLHIHPVTTTNTSPDLGMFAEILPDASVQTMPLHFDWVCRTFQTASHVHVIHIWGV